MYNNEYNLRVWWGNKGRFVGFLGQTKPFNIPRRDTYEFTPPLDITEVKYSIFFSIKKKSKRIVRELF